MKVYIMSENMPHEGGNVKHVFASREAAESVAARLYALHPFSNASYDIEEFVVSDDCPEIEAEIAEDIRRYGGAR